MRAYHVGQKLTGLLITLSVAAGASMVCQLIGVPAPWLLGSLFGVWIFGAAVKPLRAKLGVPKWLHVPVMFGLGVLIGATFTPAITEKIPLWFHTVLAMAVATVLATAVGFIWLVKLRGYDKTLALLCCIPGGQTEVVALSREWVEKDYVVALCHLVRVAVVFCSAPLLLALVQGADAVNTSATVLANLPRLSAVPLPVQIQFVAIALTGYAIARLCRLPVPHLLGPMLLSAALHATSVVSIPRINECVLLAQIVIGGAVGARLAQIPFADLMGYLVDALTNAVLVISTYGLLAVLLSQFTEVSLLNLLLAFIPGGLYEITLLTLLFGFDVAFVTFHHVLRVLMIYLSLPLLISYPRK